MYNRDWYKANAGGRWSNWGVYGLTPVVKYLIIANVVVFIAQFWSREVHLTPLEQIRKYDPQLDRLLRERGDDPETLQKLRKEYPELEAYLSEKSLSPSFRGKRVSIVQEWCQLDTEKVLHGQVWRLFTHAFCHERLGIWHIFFNMLFLYWFGCTIEAMYGSREFLLFYFAAILVAGLAFVGLDLATGFRIPGIGASGAVMAVTMLYALHFPRETIYVFWIVRIEMRWLMLFYVIFDLHPVLLALAGDQFAGDGVAHSAHLGGLAFGFLYGWNEWRLEPLFRWLPAPTRGLRPRPRLRVVRNDPQPLEPISPPDAEMERVDEILRKIADTGQASLSDEERDLLRRASERMKSRRGRA
jgi:membrane associated rhomboid family serine protease